MAAADVAARPPHERSNRRKPFTQWMRSLANLKNKGGDQQEKNNARPFGRSYAKKSSTQRTKKDGTLKNNPYPQSGAHLQLGQSPVSSRNGPLSIATATSQPQHGRVSAESMEQNSTCNDREAQSTSNKSGAPTLATNSETVHSDGGNSKAATVATHNGALSDGVGHDSTFSSPSQSQHSLTTTLTTIQSTSAGNILGGPATTTDTTPTHHGSLNNPNPVMFSHQYPVSPGPSTNNAAISAIPRHMTEQTPNTYERATANGLLTDNASILTLASSSKRRRRSIESQTDASVRALAPSSVWGGSRESLPLSVLSGNNAEREPSSGIAAQPRRSIGGLASAERASVYSSSGVAAPALASERNSYYSYSHSHKQPGTKGADLADAKSLRSITNIDARSQYGDARSVNADSRSLVGGGDMGSLKNYEGSVRSGALGHGRQDSLPGSTHSPVTPGAGGAPAPVRQLSTGGATLSRRSIDWQRDVDEEVESQGANV